MTGRFFEGGALLAKIDPASHSAEKNTGYVSLANYKGAIVILHCGVIGGNLDVDIEQAKDTSGTGAKAFDSGNYDMNKTATTDNNTVSLIDIPTAKMDVANGFDCLNVEVTPASAGIFAVEVWGYDARYKPVSTAQLDDLDY